MLRWSRGLITLLLAALTHLLPAQDHDWWAANVQWDGKTHWSTYIISKPRYLGPNGLPIPELVNGKTPERSLIAMEGQAHFSRGDQTLNPWLRAMYSVTPGKIALELLWIPVEYAHVSHAVKTERRVFHHFYDRRWATGDVYVQTYLQLMRQEKRGLDLMLRMSSRLPASNMQGAARFTDAPGYSMDLSAGSNLSRHWRIMGMAGLYVWQTNQDDQFQNDAFLFGAGTAWTGGPWQLELGCRGYLGYMGAGDDPIALSIQGGYTAKRWGWKLGLQQGFRDLRYATVQVGVQHFFEEKDQ